MFEVDCLDVWFPSFLLLAGRFSFERSLPGLRFMFSLVPRIRVGSTSEGFSTTPKDLISHTNDSLGEKLTELQEFSMHRSCTFMFLRRFFFFLPLLPLPFFPLLFNAFFFSFGFSKTQFQPFREGYYDCIDAIHCSKFLPQGR